MYFYFHSYLFVYPFNYSFIIYVFIHSLLLQKSKNRSLIQMILVEGGCFAPYVTESRSQNQKNFSLGIRNPVLSNREWYLECTGVKSEIYQ